MVSIIPGIEIAAPDRTETSNGFRGEPKPSPVMPSSLTIPLLSTLFCAASVVCGVRCFPHHAVGKTKPGGTANPAPAIRIKFQALLPASSAPPGGSNSPGEMAYKSSRDGACLRCEDIAHHLVAEDEACPLQTVRSIAQ